ncbi:hypothetical protein [Pasteurella multocida]|uniref:hypothetical protein n=1 Tax=Pasteurella multocida TaxID=747 RepID=UPI002021B8CB|nr:hypothetical protein [Pasteurella multocida]MCL7817965.1 hypothetical protein [Pasteurella multocida]MEB3458135.1 hypothetical protein [Pasteurella multocida]MEB3476656.1 hypothetical protein [Pasteurella multocida]MEB3489227.1 hypothetical protein [Pasteurella multocida]MEB3490950.1 hypothetical protein [Pasteurella multocida]
MITNIVVNTAISLLLDKFKNSNGNETVDHLLEERKKNEIKMDMAAAEAKVLQELAIARRIELAQDVQIEEYYDLEGKGNLGVEVKKDGVGLGILGAGKRVSKRIFKFNGVNSELLEAVSKELCEGIGKELLNSSDNACNTDTKKVTDNVESSNLTIKKY